MRRLVVTAAAAVGAATVIAAAVIVGSGTPHRPAPSAASTPAVPAAMSAALSEESVAKSAPFPVDDRGWTYGAIPDKGSAPYDKWPDLVAVSMGGSEVGFVRKTDLRYSDDPADNPRTPAEMLAYSKALPATAPIYAPDGSTVLGSMPLAPKSTGLKH